MKTVQDIWTKDIRRVSDEDAATLVRSHGFRYVPKRYWKEAVRYSKPVAAE